MPLTRRTLYDLVWSKPLTKVAAELEISDVGLAKICDRHRVPTPPRGYWAKIEAGKKVKQALFAELDDPHLDRIEITGGLSRLPEPVKELVACHKAERLERRAAERKVFTPPVEIAPPKATSDIHPAIRQTAKVLRSRSAQDGEVARAFGDGLCGVEVGVQSVERAIAILDAVARALAEKGLHVTPDGNQMRVVSGPEKAEFSLKEVTRTVPHEPSEAELAEEARRQKRRERYWRGEISWDSSFQGKAWPEKDALRTGQLFLQIEGYSDGVRRKWADGKTQTMESLVPSIVQGFEVLIAARKAERERREERERKWKEHCRRRELAKARVKREADRGRFTDHIIETHREIACLHTWLAESWPVAEQRPGSAYRRMVEWVQAKLDSLIASVEPNGIEKQLAENRLFPDPDADELYDPLGEPEEKYYWQFD